MTKDYDMTIMNVKENATKYDKLVELDGINEVKYFYYYMDENTTYNDGKKFATMPFLYTTNKDTDLIVSKNKKISELKSDEIIIDEKIAFKNKLKVGDKIKITYGDLNKTFDYKIVGLCDSSNFTTSRNLIAINYDHYIKDITDIPAQVLLVTDKDTDKEAMKETLKKEIKEVSIRIQTTEEYISEQESQASSIMSIFYVILGLSVFLSFIGIVNNQIISFIQRRRELAVLNSTCMSKAQLRKMLFTETIIANLVASILVLITSYAATGFIDFFMQGIDMYMTISYDLITVLKFVGIIYVVLLFTLIIPVNKLRKMNIVNEIKYE
jgi:ABC-type lipoprotein release transport system permease subunit